MERKDLETRLGVWVVSRLEAKVLDAHLGKEHLHESNQITQGDTVVGNHTFDLMKLGQVRCIDCLVSEHAVNREQLRWLEPTRLMCDRIQHGRGYRCRVCAQN